MKQKIIALSLATILGCTNNKDDCPTSTYEISIGDYKHICQLDGNVIQYAVMPNDKVFSFGYGYDPRLNLFFPANTKEFKLGRQYNIFSVDSVSPEKIKFTYVGDKK